MNNTDAKNYLGANGQDAGYRKKAAIFVRNVTPLLETMYDRPARDRIARSFDLHPSFLTLDDLVSGRVDVRGIEVLFGTWGFPVLDETQVRQFESLRHVFYGAGSIKRFGLPFLNANIGISSSKATNSRVVADFCLGQILLASKRYFQNIAQYSSFTEGKALKDFIHPFPGYRGTAVALIGCGKVSRYLIEHLRQRNFMIQVVDPFLSDEESVRLGVVKTTLEKAFSECSIVSNHLPDLPALAGVIQKKHFESMPVGSTFMNTGRGAQLREDDLVEVLAKRPDIIALLDVTEPEPPVAGSKLYSLKNILLSSHIAGCVGHEANMLIDEAIESAEKWLRQEPLDNLELLEQFHLIA